MQDMTQYLITEFIEEYEDGALDRPSLERRIVGILGPEKGARVLEEVPTARIGRVLFGTRKPRYRGARGRRLPALLG